MLSLASWADFGTLIGVTEKLPLEYQTSRPPPIAALAPHSGSRGPGRSSIAVAHLMAAGIYVLWGVLYVFHSTVNPEIATLSVWHFFAFTGFFLLTAALAVVRPFAAAVIAISGFIGTYVLQASGNPQVLLHGMPVKAILLIILLRAVMMAIEARARASRGRQ